MKSTNLSEFEKFEKHSGVFIRRYGIGDIGKNNLKLVHGKNQSTKRFSNIEKYKNHLFT